MNKHEKQSEVKVGDLFALELQKLRMKGMIDDEQPLLRIENRKEAAHAPFQFDIAKAKLHRTTCDAIPRDSWSALYAMWEIGSDEMKYACEKCRPTPLQGKTMKKNTSLDILFGFLSILDQFGSILNERGKEYRKSERGIQIERTIENLLSELDQKQKTTLDSVLSSLDNLLKVIDDYNQSLQEQGSSNNGNRRMSSTVDRGMSEYQDRANNT